LQERVFATGSGLAFKLDEFRTIAMQLVQSIDSRFLEANAAMKSIVRRDTEESYTEYLKRLAKSACTDEAILRRLYVQNRTLPQPIAGFNSALLLRKMIGAGTQSDKRRGGTPIILSFTLLSTINPLSACVLRRILESGSICSIEKSMPNRRFKHRLLDY